jgi:hypothetical protein
MWILLIFFFSISFFYTFNFLFSLYLVFVYTGFRILGFSENREKTIYLIIFIYSHKLSFYLLISKKSKKFLNMVIDLIILVWIDRSIDRFISMISTAPIEIIVLLERKIKSKSFARSRAHTRSVFIFLSTRLYLLQYYYFYYEL